MRYVNLTLSPLNNTDKKPLYQLKKHELDAAAQQYVNHVFGNAKVLSLDSAYGKLFTVGYSDAMKGVRYIKENFKIRFEGENALPQGKRFVVKLTFDKGRTVDSWDSFVKDNVHESLVHKHVHGSCVKLECSRTEVCGAQITPEFYYAAADKQNQVFITIMGIAPGTTLEKTFASRKVTARLYVAVEKAVLAMWMMGVAHADLHSGNIMVHNDEVRIIDFGLGVILAGSRRDKVRKAVEEALTNFSSLSNAGWYSNAGVGKYVNGIMLGRRFPWYNPDGKMLRALWNDMSDTERAKVPALRLKAWSCVAKRNRSPSPSSRTTSRTSSGRTRSSSGSSQNSVLPRAARRKILGAF
jgi:hypothetical protein